MKVIAAVAAACPVASMTITLSIIYHRDSYYATEIFTVSTLFMYYNASTMPVYRRPGEYRTEKKPLLYAC